MAYIVVRTIKGRQYRYLQRSYRAGKKVKTVSEYLGPVGAILRAPRRLGRAIGGLIEANRTTGPIIDEEAMLRDVKAKDAAHARMIERFQEETGLKMPERNPIPVDKPAPTVGGFITAPEQEAPNNAPPSSDNEHSTDATAATETPQE
jgi:hypothetical protein